MSMRTAIMEMYGAKKVKREAWVPESILDDDVSHFMGAAAAAKKAGKSHFDFGGKKYKVTMKSDAAKKIDEESCPECGADGECQCEQPVQEAADMDPKDHVKYNDEMEMYCVYNKDGKVVAKFKDEEDANNYAMKNHDDLMDEGVNEAAGTAQHRPTPETSDTYNKQMNNGEGGIPMGKKKDFVNQHNMEVAYDAEELYKQNKYEALSKTPARPGDKSDGDKNVVNPIPTNMVDGMRAALAKMKNSGE